MLLLKVLQNGVEHTVNKETTQGVNWLLIESWKTMETYVKTPLIHPGLLIFRVVAEPQNSGKSVKSRKIHKNMQNTMK